MGFYIFWGLNAFMALVFIFVMSFTLERGAFHKKPWKEIFKTLFKRLGIVVIVYIALLYIIGAIFTKSYNKECSPNKEDIAIMKPMAETISNYIIQKGIPDSMKNISNLPYKLNVCKKLDKDDEECLFIDNNSTYKVNLYLFTDNNYVLELYTESTKTGLISSFKFNTIQKVWIIDGKIKDYNNNILGICNPMRQ